MRDFIQLSQEMGASSLKTSQGDTGNLLFQIAAVDRSSPAQVFSEYSVPRRNYDRYGAMGLGLAGEPDKRSWLSRIDIAEQFDLLSFACRHVRQFIRSPDYSYPTCSTRCGAALNRYWSLNTSWIDCTPIARAIGLCSPGEILGIVKFIFCGFVVLIMVDSPFLVHCL